MKRKFNQVYDNTQNVVNVVIKLVVNGNEYTKEFIGERNLMWINLICYCNEIFHKSEFIDTVNSGILDEINVVSIPISEEHMGNFQYIANYLMQRQGLSLSIDVFPYV